MRGLVVILLLSLLVGCSKTPDNVIDESDMADLLVDIHKGEAYVQSHSSEYYNDSLKKAFKQSIFQEHGVTQAQFDSSLVWYGKHIDVYVKVYDNVIKKLEHQNKTLLADAKKAKAENYVEGDSVNLWDKSNIRILSHFYGDSIMSFDYKATNDFKKGDVFVWKYKLLGADIPISLMIGVDYQDGSTGYYINNDRKEGWNDTKFQTDSTKKIRRIYGVATATPGKNGIMFIDSIQLNKLRLNRDNYYYIFQQKVLQPHGSRYPAKR